MFSELTPAQKSLLIKLSDAPENQQDFLMAQLKKYLTIEPEEQNTLGSQNPKTNNQNYFPINPNHGYSDLLKTKKIIAPHHQIKKTKNPMMPLDTSPKPQVTLYQIINDYYQLVRVKDKNAKDIFLKTVSFYAETFKLSVDELTELNQFAQTIIDIKENKSPFIDLGLFKKHLMESHLKIILREAILYGAKIKDISEQQRLNTQNQLTILTEVSWGTLGDYNAAARLIRLLKSAHPKLTIHWIIKGRVAEIPDELATSDTLFIDKINSWDELFLEKKIITNLKRTDAILAFPTFHFLTDNHLEQLKYQFKKQIISCLEYSFGVRKTQPDVIELKTGLGEDEMGIFILPPTDGHPLTQIQKQQIILDVLFPECTLAKTPMPQHDSSETEVQSTAQPGVSEDQAKAYEANHMLFFGYANKDALRTANKGANVSNFVRMALSVAEQDKKKDVDIVVPITREQLNGLNIDYQKYSQIRFITQKNNTIHEEALYKNPSPQDLPQLRIINLFRFENNTFTQLVAASHPLKLCTGDQSLSDVVSVENAIVFYQVMQWKQCLAENYLEIAKQALKAAQRDSEQSAAISFLTIVKNMQELDLEVLKPLLINPQLLEEFQVIHRYIFENKNLNHILPTNLLAFLDYLKIEERLLVSAHQQVAPIIPQTSKLGLFSKYEHKISLEDTPQKMESNCFLGSPGSTD
ncbi:hypothetical protein Lgra_2493 [Legionella gratiana]|uniref:Uncharacterized protein n=1 Tax=Legionella gratiana TaxID=45066 RepID=A0A378JDF1_9GAMM|nr:hypothetical protein [Legionella gratiana]KTD09258.1 hypothetical protein Lgra_2493 [Legionella gratiana]STX45489.1 Uncharacterised protein [Legionella gratiana]